MSENIVDDGKNTNEETTKDSPKSTKRKLRSLVWNDFTKQERDGTWEAICNYCKKVLTGKSKNGTTHLKNHLNACSSYKRTVKRSGGVGQMLLKSGEIKLDGSADIECFKFSQEFSREELARMIILHEYPFSIVHQLGFKAFAHSLNPEFKFVCRTTIKEDCMKIFEKEKIKLYDEFDKLRCRVSLTSDMWSSNRNMGYLCITCHYINDNWKLQKRIISFMHVEAPHTGDAITKVILEKLYDWNLDRKLFSIVLDNCSTNDVVVRELQKVFSTKGSLPLNGDLFHVRCCTHILNLIVQDGLKELTAIVSKVRETVKYVKGSQARLEKFQKVAKQVHAPKKSLVDDCPTRWNSTYLMLERAYDLKDAISRLAELDNKFKHAPSIEEWETVEVIMECLEVFYDLTEKFSGSKYPTANIYFNDICTIYVALKEWLHSPYPFLLSMAGKMIEKFEKYWKITNNVLAIASILNPCYKMKSVDYFFNLIYDAELECELKINGIRNVLRSLYNAYVVRHSQANQGTSSFDIGGGSGIGIQNVGISKGFTSKRLASARLALDQFIEESSSSVVLKSELDKYLEEPVHLFKKGENDSFDILEWWKVNAGKYPVLSMMARDILAIPVSTVASESAFSTGGRVISTHRSSLKSSTAQGLICTQDWIRSKMIDSQLMEEEDGLSTISRAIDLDSEFDRGGAMDGNDDSN